MVVILSFITMVICFLMITNYLSYILCAIFLHELMTRDLKIPMFIAYMSQQTQTIRVTLHINIKQQNQINTYTYIPLSYFTPLPRAPNYGYKKIYIYFYDYNIFFRTSLRHPMLTMAAFQPLSLLLPSLNLLYCKRHVWQ